MKKIIGISGFCLSIFLIMSCNSSTENVEDAQSGLLEASIELDEANAAYLADMEKYKTETATKIAANEAIVLDFNNRIDSQKLEARIAYKQKIADLESKNSDMKMRLDNYKQDNKEGWEKFKTEFSRDMEELGKAFQDLTVQNVN